MLQRIATQDHRLMRRINAWRAPRWIRVWMLLATRGGDGWLWMIMGVAVLLFGGADRFCAAAASATAAAVGSILFVIVKRKCGRRRPCHIAEHCWATLLPPDQFSFPSGHTITAFAVATPLIFFYPGMILGLLFCAISIALSRIMLGMHFLSDVVAGAAIGSLLGYAAFLLYS